MKSSPQRGVLLRQRRNVPVAVYAIVMFLGAALVIAAVAVTLDRNARRSTWQQNVAELRGGARVGASNFRTLRADLRVEVSQLATSLPLQRAVVTRDEGELRRFAATHRARIVLPGGHSVGDLAPAPRIVSTATINDGTRVLAKVTVGLPLGEDVLSDLLRSTPLRSGARLLLVREGRVIAGGPGSAPVQLQDDRFVLGGTPFAAGEAPLGVAGASVLAVEPVLAIEEQSRRYRRFVFLIAAITLAFAAALAVRVARPFARVLGDVALLSRQARTDSLSGLANRRELTERLELELARADRLGESVAFVLVDIDDFKSVNDSFGHQAGDEVIQAVGRALMGSVREIDLAARYGGEEFALVLTGATLTAAKRVAERVRRAVAETVVAGPRGEPLSVTASFGIAEYPTYATVESLVGAADAALYQAKRGGKDQVATATLKGQAARKPRKLASVV